MIVPSLTAEYLREVLDYNSETGIFTWKVALNGRVKSGQIAGCLHSRGYQHIGINGKVCKAHRLAWLYVYGVFPQQNLDHINGNKADNRIANLRECDQVLNQQNRSLRGSGTTGYLGVSFNKSAQGFMATIAFKRRQTYLGLFDTAQEAHGAYLEAKKTLHQFQGR